MAKKAKFTEEQKRQFAELAAEGSSQVVIAERLNITRYSVKRLREDYETNIAIDRVRLTDTFPKQFKQMTSALIALAETVADLRNDVCDVNVTLKKVNKAMHRIQVENKNLREERKKARADVRRLRRELWKVRGY